MSIAAALVAAEAAPTDSMAQFRLGYAYLANEMFQEAVAPFERAMELDPTFFPTLENLSSARTLSGDGAGGEVAARAALALKPASHSAYFSLGNALRLQGDALGAVDAYRVSLGPNQENWERAQTRHNFGLALQDLGRLREALEQQTLALQLEPDFMLALMAAANLHESLGEFEAAHSMYRRASEVDTQSWRAWEGLGLVLLKMNLFAESILAYERVLELHPDEVNALSNLSLAYMVQGRPTDALLHAERAVELSPDDEALAKNLTLIKARYSN